MRKHDVFWLSIAAFPSIRRRRTAINSENCRFGDLKSTQKRLCQDFWLSSRWLAIPSSFSLGLNRICWQRESCSASVSHEGILMQRPERLPDFTDPPLDEVVLGVQFAPSLLYTSVCAIAIWELFKGEFPEVQEQPILEPQLELFGGVNFQSGPKVQLVPAPIGSRLWFLSSESSEVIHDREGKPLARLRYDLHSVFSVDGKSKAYRLSITYKAKPAGSDLESAMKFIAGGREAIVERFDEITTVEAINYGGSRNDRTCENRDSGTSR